MSETKWDEWLCLGFLALVIGASAIEFLRMMSKIDIIMVLLILIGSEIIRRNT